MTAGRYAAALVLAAGQLASLAACSRQTDAVPTREKVVEAGAAIAMKTAPSVVVPAMHATPAASLNLLSRSCQQVCAASEKLHCSRAKACEPNCVAMASAGTCESQIAAFYDCLKTQPSEHWECLEDGSAAIREGYCEQEQAGFAQCVQGT
jgi:hypothetical protein